MKRFFKRVFMLITILLLLAVISIPIQIVYNKLANTSYEDLNSTDQMALKELSTIYGNFEKNSDKIWDKNYRFDKLPLVIVSANKDRGMYSTHSFMLNVKGAENMLTAVEIKLPKGLNLPKVYRVTGVEPSILPTHIFANFGGLEIKNQKPFWFKYHKQMFTNPKVYFEFQNFLLHEATHYFIQENWTYDRNGDYIENYPVDAENFAIIGMEYNLLDKALKSENVDEVKLAMEELIKLRTYRYQKWPQLVSETKSEAIEGSARYVEYRYNALIGGYLKVLSTNNKGDSISFSKGFDTIVDGGAKVSVLKRSVMYETGSALELIMDKMGIAWKPLIEDSQDKPGKAQYFILKDFYKVDPASNNIDPIKEKYNYPEFLRKGESIVNNANSKK